MAKHPNKNERDACCRCGVILPTAGAGDRTVDQAKDDELVIHQPGAGDPPQFMCGKCSREVAE